jgi:hypothetical protein
MYSLKDGDIIRLGECVFLQFKMPLSDVTSVSPSDSLSDLLGNPLGPGTNRSGTNPLGSGTNRSLGPGTHRSGTNTETGSSKVSMSVRLRAKVNVSFLPTGRENTDKGNTDKGDQTHRVILCIYIDINIHMSISI